MRPAARLAAAIEVLDDMLAHHRPPAMALADWGKRHRFAGSGDRSAIGVVVYDALRRKRSITARMGGIASGRSLALGAAAEAFGISGDEVAALCDGGQYAPAALSELERSGLSTSEPTGSAAERADVQDWLWPYFEAAFGTGAADEAAALARRAPVDMRVNTLKSSRDKAAAALADLAVEPTLLSPIGLRIAAPKGLARLPNIEADALYIKGLVEIQDEGSQLAALIAAAALDKPGQVLDLCAGGGGKTLALAAAFDNHGQIHAYDADKQRLAPIHDRLQRAGVRNVKVLQPGRADLDALAGRMDLVLVDAPCTGTGVWRRRPDAKWRLSSEQLDKRLAEQRQILDQAVGFLRPGGRLVYVTCSLLPVENAEQVAALLERSALLKPLDIAPLWTRATAGAPLPDRLLGSQLTLSPATSDTDGFFIATLVAD